MKFLSKFVVSVLAICLWVAPAVAPLSCASAVGADAHRCCHGRMASMQMRTEDQIAAMDSSTASIPPCCQLSPKVPAEPNPAQQTQTSRTAASVETAISVYTLADSKNLLSDAWRVPDRLAVISPQSLLCTFRI